MPKQIVYGGAIRDLSRLTATRRYASGGMVEEMSSVGKLCNMTVVAVGIHV